MLELNTNREFQKNKPSVSPEEVKRVKGLGALWDKTTPDCFNLRVITRNGKITAKELALIANLAKEYGNGVTAMTTRLTLEIQQVPLANIEPLRAKLQEVGMDIGGTGSKVRPVVSCKGTTCQYGLIDTFDLSQKLHKIFYEGYRDVVLPHKFKIAVGGCPNNCVKPDLNDLGIVGQRVPSFDYSKCRGCKVCQVEQNCPIKVAKLVDGKLSVSASECNNCGRCKNRCPFGVTETYTTGYKVYIAGRWGKKVAFGKPLNKIFLSEEKVIDLVERTILFFRDEGITGERLSDTVTRLGFDYVEQKLLSGQVDKAGILNKTVVGGASC